MWLMRDTERDLATTTIQLSKSIMPTSSSSMKEVDSTDVGRFFTSNGFKIRGTDSSMSIHPGATYIYAAFAENPFPIRKS
jgi:hypothetical protein